MRTLYFINAPDPDDYASDYGLFVVADSCEHAHELWKKHWWPSDDPPFYAGDVLTEAPETKMEETMLIYEINIDRKLSGSVHWQDLKVAGYVVA